MYVGEAHHGPRVLQPKLPPRRLVPGRPVEFRVNPHDREEGSLWAGCEPVPQEHGDLRVVLVADVGPGIVTTIYELEQPL